MAGVGTSCLNCKCVGVVAQVDTAFSDAGEGSMDDGEAAAKRVAREGRLWANLFVYALDAGRFEARAP